MVFTRKYVIIDEGNHVVAFFSFLNDLREHLKYLRQKNKYKTYTYYERIYD